jgi:hypothetical protein
MKNIYLPYLLILFFFSSLSLNSWSQVTPVWTSAIRAGGTATNIPYSIDFDNQGNMYISGAYDSPTITFGTFTLVNKGLRDFFFVKYDASGNVVWAKSEGTQFGNEGARIAVDGAGNIILAGYTSYSNGFTIGSFTMGQDGSFLIKYDTNGNILWANGSHGGSGSNPNSISDMELDPSGNIIISGNFYTSTMYFDDLNNYINPLDDYNTFVCKFNSSGTMLWGRPTSANSSNGMTVDNAGNISIAVVNNTGVYFNNTSTLVFGAFSNTYDIFLARYDANGNMLWAKSEGGAGSDYVFDISTDNAQNVYITGWFSSDSIRFGNYTVIRPASFPNAMYLVKYNPNGVAQWAKTASGNANASLLKKDSQNNLYCMGSFTGATMIIGGVVLNNHTPSTTYDFFVSKFDTSGNFEWAASNGGTGPDYLDDMKPGPDGYLYLAGEFRSPSITLGTSTLTKIGVADIFIAKLDQIPSPVIANVSNKCAAEPTAFGKLLNPPANTYTISITMDGNPLTYQPVDSSFQYFNSGITGLGSHNIVVKYTRANVSAQTDTSYVVSSSAAPVINISATSVSICSGTQVTFTATATNGGSTPTYQWLINGVNAGTNSNTFTTSTLNNNDQVKVTMTSSLSCASPTTATSNIITMIVTPAPTAHAGNDTTICAGSSVQLQGSGGTVYQWTPAVGLNNPNIANPIATPLATTAYILRVSNGGSCIAYDTILITLLPSAMPTITIGTASNNICTGTQVTFTATPTNGGASPAYQWQVNGNNAGTNSNTFTTSTLTNNAQVKVILNSSLGCALPATATSNIITMTVTTTPIANAGNDVNICTGGSTQLQASGGTTYSWSPVTGLSNPNIANPIASPAATTIYTVTVSNGINCTAMDAVVVSVGPPATPVVSISTTNNTICQGSVATFTAVATYGGSNPVFQWQVNGINAGTNNNSFITSTLSNNDQVKVILTSSSGCVTSPTATSNSIVVTVDQLATPLISLSNRLYFVTNPDAAATYAWQQKINNIWGDVIPAATGITYTAPAGGEYRVKAIKGACTAYSASQVTSRNVNTLNHPFGIYLYPNPNNGILNIDSIRIAQKWETLDITDLAGRLVLTFNINNQSSVSLNISMLKPGTYFAQLKKIDGVYYTVEFVKL